MDVNHPKSGLPHLPHPLKYTLQVRIDAGALTCPAQHPYTQTPLRPTPPCSHLTGHQRYYAIHSQLVHFLYAVYGGQLTSNDFGRSTIVLVSPFSGGGPF